MVYFEMSDAQQEWLSGGIDKGHVISVRAKDRSQTHIPRFIMYIVMLARLAI